MVIARKIAYNVLISSVGKALSTALALVGIGLITRYLGKAGFGNYATAIAFFSLFGALADLGIYSVATREISRPNADDAHIMGKVFSLRLISSLIVFIFSFLIVYWLPYPLEVKRAIYISAAAFIFASSYGVLNGIFQKNLAMDKVAISELVGKIVQVGVIFLAYQKNLGFLAVMVSLLLSMVVNFCLVFLWSRKYLKFKIEIDWSYWRKFLRESLPMGISIIVTFIYFKMDTILLSVMKSSSEVGIYNVAYKVIENLSFFPGMVIGLILPIMSHSIFTDRKRFEDIANKVFKFFLILVVPLVIGTLYLAGGIINIIGGSGFAESELVLKILIFALAFIFFGNISNTILLAGNLQKKLMYALSFCAAFNIIANIILIPRYSYIGSAAVSAVTEFLVTLTTFYLIARNMSYKPKTEKLFGILLAGFCMAMFLHFSAEAGLFVRLFGSALLYGLGVWLTKTVSTEEIKSIFKREKGEEADISFGASQSS